jgi:superfamily II DNA or RNA helicase
MQRESFNQFSQGFYMSFDNLGLKPELLRAVADKGYTAPTPIQLEAIPAVLSGRDVLAGAQTGTGKTAGFTLPILQKLGARGGRNPRALVLTPTRELAAQVAQSIQDYGKYGDLRTLVVFGGVVATSWWPRPAACSIFANSVRCRSPKCRSSCSTKPIACSTWASSATSSAC